MGADDRLSVGAWESYVDCALSAVRSVDHAIEDDSPEVLWRALAADRVTRAAGVMAVRYALGDPDWDRLV